MSDELPDQPPLPDTVFADMPCSKCRYPGALRSEWRWRMIARPIDSFSLAGVNMKFSAHRVPWPWMVCRTELGGCGQECRGQLVGIDDD